MLSEVKGSISLNATRPMPIQEADARASHPPVNTPGTSLPSTDVGTGKATARIRTEMYGHSTSASAGGKSASIPKTEHQLGIEPMKGKHVDTHA